MKAGTIVRWESQAGGKGKVKEGIIVKVIPPYCYVEASNWMDYKPKLGYTDFEYNRRNHESYLVMVKRDGKKKPFLYWPRVSGLKEICSNGGDA